MTRFNKEKPIDPTNHAGQGRQIRFWVSLARLIVGTATIVGAALTGADHVDVILGLAVLPAV